MTAINTEQVLTNQLIALKSQYEQALTDADAKAIHFREQLSHVNALLLNQLVPSKGVSSLRVQIEPRTTVLALHPQAEDTTAIPPAPSQAEDFSPRTRQTRTGKPRKEKRIQAAPKAAPKSAPSSRKGTSQTLVPAYQGLKRLDAIARVLGDSRGKEVTIDTLTQTLFGNLGAAEHKKERLRLKTLLYQGVKLGLWQKAATPSSYLIDASTSKGNGRSKKNGQQKTSPISAEPVATETTQPSPRKSSQLGSKPRAQNNKVGAEAAVAKTTATPAVKKRNSLPLLPAYEGITKLEAIRSVLKSYAGEDLHHDTIIQSLYGDLSPADLKAERVRIKTALLTGVKNKLWGRAPKPSTYRLEALNLPNESNGTSRNSSKSTSNAATKTAAPKGPAAKTRKTPIAAKTPTKAKTPRTSGRKAK
ncbi:hypothetical protein [Altericista sp. CCNU0014]|uniref:hypothetical protein n=1 Tax=Altericista sp. CCNU0014 TaxID=3082949 RepID=UPI003851429C